MFCFKCGNKLPPKTINCQECDSPHKRRKRYRRRMILGLLLFLSGAVCGSLFDSLFFEGRIWDYSFLGALRQTKNVASETVVLTNIVASKTLMVDTTLSGSIADSSSVLSNSGLSDAKFAPESLMDVLGQEVQETLTNVPVIDVDGNIGSETSARPISEAQAVEIPAKTDVSDIVDKLVNSVFSHAETLEKKTGNSYHGSISRDGENLIFVSNRIKINGRNTYQCFIKKPTELASAKRVFEWPGNIWTPELTPNGKKVVFSSDSKKPEHLFAYDMVTQKNTQLTNGDTKNMMCAISPDGERVAFTSSRKNAPDNIWLIDINGKNMLQITSGKEDDREPRWSADGKSLYFTRIFSYMKKSSIMRINLDPIAEPETIVGDDHRNWLPDISPNGSMLAYVRSEKPGGRGNVIVLRDLVSNKDQVLKPLGENNDYFRPIWSADGSGFVFHSGSGSNRSLYFARFKPES